jgi:2-C-methyl-D-erythritol 4-phosphate cytidylyltransferase
VKATAILAAAGSGDRLGSEEPKAFVELAGRPMAAWSLAALQAAGAVDRVLVTVPGGYAEHPALTAAEPVPGGPSRSESVANALARVESELVVVHDAARPLVTPELVDGALATLAADPELAGVVAAAPVTDTTKEVLRGREVHRTLDRSSLWAAQTPQAFRTGVLREALGSTELLAQASDDAMLVERSGGRVLIQEASPENFKVTTELDLRLAAHLLSEREGDG